MTTATGSESDLLSSWQERTGSQQHQASELPAIVFWPAAELDQAVSHLVKRSGLPSATGAGDSLHSVSASPAPTALDAAGLDSWIGALASHWGLEAEPIQSTYRDAPQLLRAAGPALLQLSDPTGTGEPRFIALLQGGGRWVQLIATDGSLRRVRRSALQDALWAEATAPHAAGFQQMLARAGVASHRRSRVQRALLQEMLGSTVQRAGWLLRVPPGAPLWQQARHAGLAGTLGTLIGGYLAQLLLTVAAWWMIGRGALAGHFDWGWLLGWALLLVSVVPFQAWVELAQRRLAIGMGALFKQRLLAGVLQLHPEEIRHQGAGQFLGRVLASDTVEQLGLASGFVAVLALFQLAVAVAVLAAGAGGWLHAGLLLAWVAVTLGLSWLYWRRSRDWVRTYREMTNDLVERMTGHRTRLAQEARAQWHDDEDPILAHYLQIQQRLDAIESKLKALAPRGWMALGMGGLAHSFLFNAPTTTQVAISLGGILLAYQALNTIVLGFKSVVGARLAWREVSTLFHAASRSADNSRRLPAPPVRKNEPDSSSTPVLTMRDVHFRYRAGGRPVLRDCTLQIHAGEQLLLEGPSGGGKSTLAGILAGLRAPESGLLLLRDVDQQTLGLANWRERVVAVPQFHENYILTGTLAFNLLLGRGWPPQPEDLVAARSICQELGLGDLIARMPAGMQQMVGESGWQLSHGERSRVFIARALLQEPELMVLDESFAALDPENLERALECVLERAPTLLAIAHP